MTLDEIWQQLREKEPGLIDADYVVSMKSTALRKLLTQVYAHGAKSVPKESVTTDLFGDLFGGLK